MLVPRYFATGVLAALALAPGARAQAPPHVSARAAGAAPYAPPPPAASRPNAPHGVWQPTAARRGRSRGARAATGAALGAVAGGVLGYFATRAACDACDDAAPLYAGAALGAGAGALLGVGVALTTDRDGRTAARLAGPGPRAAPPNAAPRWTSWRGPGQHACRPPRSQSPARPDSCAAEPER